MAIGDVISEISSVNTTEYLTIQPGAGVEWDVHNIMFSDDVEIYFTDGSSSIKINSFADAGSWCGVPLHCTNSHYLTVKNVAATSTIIGYSGVVSK